MDPFRLFIILCWLLFFVVWIVSASFVKRTVERSPGWPRLLALSLVVAVYALARGLPGLQRQLWPRTVANGLLADLLALLGLGIAFWARATLGSNWSATIAFKEGHELILRGPYAWVRHPIYTGLLLMGLGTAVEAARIRGFVLLGVAVAMVVIKAGAEERLMLRHFPDAYAEYRRRVRALVPWLW